jgi:hypothetical protein
VWLRGPQPPGFSLRLTAAPEALEGAANGGFEDLSHRVVLVHLANGGFEDLSHRVVLVHLADGGFEDLSHRVNLVHTSCGD